MPFDYRNSASSPLVNVKMLIDNFSWNFRYFKIINWCCCCHSTRGLASPSALLLVLPLSTSTPLAFYQPIAFASRLAIEVSCYYCQAATVSATTENTAELQNCALPRQIQRLKKLTNLQLNESSGQKPPSKRMDSSGTAEAVDIVSEKEEEGVF